MATRSYSMPDCSLNCWVTGDEGGRSLLKRHADEVVTVETGNQFASYDVDTWEAYRQVLESLESRR